METWQKQLSQSVTKVKDLPFLPDLSEKYRQKLETVAQKFPIRINSYFLDQVKSANDPLWKQVVPTPEELDDWLDDEDLQQSDPLNEEGDMPVPELVHRYPDRVLLMLNICSSIKVMNSSQFLDVMMRYFSLKGVSATTSPHLQFIFIWPLKVQDFAVTDKN